MKKRILNGVLCTALSIMMATGGVAVNAAPKTKTVTKEISQALVSSIEKTESKNVVIKNADHKVQGKASVRLNNVTVPTIWNTTVKQAEKSVTLQDEQYIGSVVIKNAGTFLGIFGTEFKLCDTNDRYIMGSTDGILYSANMKPGTYRLYTKEVVRGTSKISLSLYPNQNNRTLGSKTSMIGGTGKDSYQYFKVTKRGAAAFRLEGVWINPTSFGKSYGITSYVQKKSGSSWKTISSSQYTSANQNYSTAYGLAPGSYRIVLKSSYKSGVIGAAYKQVTASDSYGTSKKKAKTISRKKAKKQTFLTTDSSKKEHWYKINVSKKRTTYIDVTSLATTGSIYCTVSGKARFKTKRIKYGTRYYLNAPKGTYYIKVQRYSKNATGAYQVKYVK